MSEKKEINNRLLVGLSYLTVGVLFCIFRGSVLNWIMTVIGAIFIVKAVFALSLQDWISAAVHGVIGVLLIVGGWLLLQVVMVLLGIMLTIVGVAILLSAIHERSFKEAIVPVITLIVGIMLIVSCWFVADWFFVVCGVALVIDGVMTLFGEQKY